MTLWGTPMPIWRLNQHVLVQLYSPDGAWLPAIVRDVLSPLEFKGLSMDEIKAIPPSRLANLMCRYTVEFVDHEEGRADVWTEIEEKFLVPTYLDERLKANAVKFTMGERVLVQMSDGPKRHTHIGHISDVFGDKVLRHKSSWHVVPRLYKVYIDELETSGHWTANSLVKIESPKVEKGVPLLPPPGSAILLQCPEA
ncbi:hypothetical protein FRC11_010026 [Ceratobasidium sp. 423]|nr:hypothetical protein FRC11_010026 [Ceratobasidium sp. 423]